MAKPTISVVGNLGEYQNPYPILTKILWNSPASSSDPAFVAGERLDGSNGMPIPPVHGERFGPYVFSFLNKAASAPQFRVTLTDYTYAQMGSAGQSSVWMYEATGQGWTMIPNPNPPEDNPSQQFHTFNPPYNFQSLANVDFGGKNYLVVADYDSNNNSGGTLGLLNMAANDAYSQGAIEAVANKTEGGKTYQAHVQDVVVVGTRIFVLVIYSTAAYDYLRSEVREYQLVSENSAPPTFDLVDTVAVSKNAVSLTYHGVGTDNYLFIPCIGGKQKQVGNNGTDSTLSMVKVLSSGFDHTVGFNEDGEMIAFSGHASAAALHDFRSFAISSSGWAFMLMGDYNSNNGFTFRVYASVASHLVDNALTGKTDPNNPGKKIPLTIFDDISQYLQSYIQEQTATSAFFWALGICKGGNNQEYLVFAKGSVNAPMDYTAYDVISYVQVGQSWNSFHKTISTAQLSGQAANLGFAINSIDISVDGGLPSTPLRSATAPSFVGRSAGVNSLRNQPVVLEELRESGKKAVEAFNKGA